MTTPAPTIIAPNPAFEEAVAKRARDLCVRAEPHATSGICVPHRAAAFRVDL